LEHGGHLSDGYLKIAVIGAGGIGGFLGGALAKSGQEVVVIARGSHLQAIRERGLRIESSALGNFTSNVKASDNPSQVGVTDLILFCVKSYDTEKVSESMIPLVGDETAVLSFQNGIDNEEKIGRKVGLQHVLAGAISIESFIAEPGVIKQTWGPTLMAMGELNGSVTERAGRIHAAIAETGLKCDLSNHIVEVLWQKFLFICPTAGICSVTRATIGEMMGLRETRDLYLAAMKEVEAVARGR
jgi:2-dehydropantoate 2-reductase